MERLTELLKQYRYGILVLLLGLGLMLIPSKEENVNETSPIIQEASETMQQQLEKILSQIDGAGTVQVFLTEAQGETRIYQQDTNDSGSSLRSETVVITDGERVESGLISQVIPARYRGAIIVCKGGDRPSVQLAIVEAVSAVTGLTSDKIVVLKMK